MIIGIEGDIGQGKTLAMVSFIVREFRELHRPIISNFELKGIPHEYVTFEDVLDMVEQERSYDSVCFAIDEAHIWLDSRTSVTKENRMFSYFLNMTGKQGINLYYTTQSFDQVDKRLRKRTTISIHVRRKGDLHLLTIRHANGRNARAVIVGPQWYEYYDTKEVVRFKKRENVGGSKFTPVL